MALELLKSKMKRCLAVLLSFVLLAACSNNQITAETKSTDTPMPTSEFLVVTQPTNAPTSIIPTETQSPQARVEAALTGIGQICELPTKDSYGEISPNGNWFAMVCRGIIAILDSHLKVINVHDGKEWIINGIDYVKEDILYPLYPYHWSTDGKYLYAKASTRASGCCWIGGYVLLVRLDLENGEQTEIANFVEEIPTGLSFSISADDKYFLSTPFASLQILDLQTGEKREFTIDVGDGSVGNPLMSLDDSKVILMLREYPQEIQGDLTYGSLVLVDLKSGLQKKLLSGMDYHETPVPINWIDDENVLVFYENRYWSLNVSTGELIETVIP